MFSMTGYQNGAAQFSRGKARPQEQTYSTPDKWNRPPNAALPKLGHQKSKRGNAAPHTQTSNMDFLNVPDQGVSG